MLGSRRLAPLAKYVPFRYLPGLAAAVAVIVIVATGALEGVEYCGRFFMGEAEAQKALYKLTAILEAEGLPYVVIGAFALKRVRATERRTAVNSTRKTRLRHGIRKMRRMLEAKDVKGATDEGMPIQPSLAVGIFVPVAVLLVWWVVRRIRRRHIAEPGNRPKAD